MTNRIELAAALETARRRLIDAEGQPVIPGWNRQIEYYFSDVDEHWLMAVVDGMPAEPVQQEAEDPDIRITMSSETFVGLMNGTISGLKAVTSGKVRVKASMADMRQMQVFM